MVRRFEIEVLGLGLGLLVRGLVIRASVQCFFALMVSVEEGGFLYWAVPRVWGLGFRVYQ